MTRWLGLALIVLTMSPRTWAADDPLTFDFQTLDEATGKPLSGVTIRAYLDGQYRLLTTDLDGHAKVPRPVDHYSYTLDFWKDGYIQERKTWSDIDAARKALPDSYVHRMKAGIGRIGGRIVDEEGKPVAGATIQLYESPPYRKVYKGVVVGLPVTTDADGRWSTGSVPPETCPIYGWVRHPEYRQGRVDKTLPELFAGKGDVVLKKGSVIEGRVLDPANNPVAGAKIFVSQRQFRADAISSTDAEGRYRLADLEPGSTDLVVLAPGLGLEKEKVEAGTSPVHADFRLQPGRELRGRVVNADREPIVGAWISLSSWNTLQFIQWQVQTDAAGRFSWDSAPVDAVEIACRRPGYADETRTVKGGEAERIWVLKRSIAIHGTVLDSKTGAKIPRFELDLGMNVPRPVQRNLGQPSKTHLWGSYQVQATDPAENFTFTIRAEGYRPFTSREFRKDETFVTYDVKLDRLSPGEGGGPTGNVSSPDGKPVSGADVLMSTDGERATLMDGAAHPPEGHMSWSGVGYVTTDDAGSFTFSSKIGTYRLAAVHASGYAQVTSEELAKSSKIVLKPWGRIEGQIAATISLEPDDKVLVWSDESPYAWKETINSSYQNIKIDSERKFVVERVTPGPIRIEMLRTVNMRSHAIARSLHLNLEEGQTAKVAIGSAGRKVVGKLAPPDDLPPDKGRVFDREGTTLTTARPHVPVPLEILLKGEEARYSWIKDWQETEEGRAYLDRNDSRQLELLSDGTFQADDLRPGDYYLRAVMVDPGGRRDEAQAMVWKRVTIPEGAEGSTVDLGSIPMSRISRPIVGQPAPPILAKTLDGQPFFLDDLRGKAVVVNFWRSDLDNCRQQIKALDDLAKEHAARNDLTIVNVSLDTDPATARKFLGDVKWPLIAVGLGDWSASPIPASYGVERYPTTLVIGPDGRVLAILKANRNTLTDDVANALKAK